MHRLSDNNDDDTLPSLLSAPGAQVRFRTLTLAALQLGLPPPFSASV